MDRAVGVARGNPALKEIAWGVVDRGHMMPFLPLPLARPFARPPPLPAPSNGRCVEPPPTDPLPPFHKGLG